MASEKDAIKQEPEAAKANSENNKDLQETEQLSLKSENRRSNVNNDDTNEESRIFPGVL